MRFFLALAHCQPATDEARARTLLDQFHPGGTAPGPIFAHPEPEVLLGVVGVEPQDSAAVFARDGRFTVTADGALYYLDELASSITNAGGLLPAAGSTTAHWILSVLTTWGPSGLSRLEGEFVSIAWDSVDRRLIAARDHTGMWPLFYTSVGGGVAVASSPRLLRRLPGVHAPLSMVAVLDDLASLEAVGPTETAFSGIARIPSSFGMQWTPVQGPKLFRIVETPIFDDDSGVPFAEAAEQLRALLVDAVRERSLTGRTSVALSGGYDSTAIFGAGNYAMARMGQPPLAAVSLSFPPGDPGREDEWISMTTRQWGVTPCWLDSERVPAIDRPLERAAGRDEPMAHVYEVWNEALAVGCRSTGADISLSGVGGDAWFSGSPVFYADLLRRGRLLRLRREWKEHLVGAGDPYLFFKTAIQPNIPEWGARAIAILRGGRRLRALTYSPIPSWVREDFAREERLIDRQMALVARRRPGESHFSAERAWFFDSQITPRVVGLLQGTFAACGVSLRMPLMDWRVVQFSASRPRWESVSGASNKHLFRAAVTGLAPDEVLAPRPFRTGLPSTYLARTAKAHAKLLLDILSGGMVLAKHGVVNPDVLRTTITSVLESRAPNPTQLNQIILLAQAELWLKAEVE